MERDIKLHKDFIKYYEEQNLIFEKQLQSLQHGIVDNLRSIERHKEKIRRLRMEKKINNIIHYLR